MRTLLLGASVAAVVAWARAWDVSCARPPSQVHECPSNETVASFTAWVATERDRENARREGATTNVLDSRDFFADEESILVSLATAVSRRDRDWLGPLPSDQLTACVDPALEPLLEQLVRSWAGRPDRVPERIRRNPRKFAHAIIVALQDAVNRQPIRLERIHLLVSLEPKDGPELIHDPRTRSPRRAGGAASLENDGAIAPDAPTRTQ